MDGCTVVMALLTGSLLTVAWLGDSRALLCRSTSAGGVATVPLTQDHRPGVHTSDQETQSFAAASTSEHMNAVASSTHSQASAEADRVREAGGMIVSLGVFSEALVLERGRACSAQKLRRSEACLVLGLSF